MVSGPGVERSAVVREVPLDQEQFALLIHLAFEWNCSPRDALTRALQQAVDQHDDGPVQ